VTDTAAKVSYSDLDSKNRQLKALLSRPSPQRAVFEERFELSWLFHENALDGLVLDPLDLKAALDHGGSDDEVLIATYQRIRNHKKALETIQKVVKDQEHSITVSFMKELHQQICYGLPERQGGAYRKEIPIHRSYYHDISQPGRIASEMNKLVRELKTKEFRMAHAIMKAADFHFRFMQIFPFDDDTGKVGRLILNYYLLSAGYPLVIIPDFERQRYYDSLRSSPKVVHDLIVDSLDTTITNSIRLITGRKN